MALATRQVTGEDQPLAGHLTAETAKCGRIIKNTGMRFQ